MKKRSILVVVALFVLSNVFISSAVSIPFDVTSDYTKAVSKLASLNIMNGYPDGTFRADRTITRAEFAKIAVAALGMSDAAIISDGSTKFSDVPEDHWASRFY